jgi:hypothetical protein
VSIKIWIPTWQRSLGCVGNLHERYKEVTGSNSRDYLIFILKQLITLYFNDVQRPERYEEK